MFWTSGTPLAVIIALLLAVVGLAAYAVTQWTWLLIVIAVLVVLVIILGFLAKFRHDDEATARRVAQQMESWERMNDL